MEKISERIDWDDYFMRVAEIVSLRSDCVRAHVGAVIVNDRKKIKGTGYNNTPSNCSSCEDIYWGCYRIKNNIPSGKQYETCRSIHAEQNAIIQAGEDNCYGSTIYIFGHSEVCILCKRFIINSGIEQVFLKHTPDSTIGSFDPEDWIMSI